jgi:hypothetical protein
MKNYEYFNGHLIMLHPLTFSGEKQTWIKTALIGANGISKSND